MKKDIKYLAILFLVLTFVSGCSKNSINDNATIEDEATTGVNPEDYVGTWSSVRPTIEVSKESMNTYSFKVSWGSSAFETTIWDYSCNFDEDSNKMDCTGSKTNYVFDEDGNEESSDVDYNDGKAIFTLNDGKLTWSDENENSGADIEFSK